MRRTIIMLLAAAFLVSATPLLAAAGGTCSDSNCSNAPTSPQDQQDVTGGELPNDQTAPKGRARGMSMDDLVPNGRAVEKQGGGCDQGGNCHEKFRLQKYRKAIVAAVRISEYRFLVVRHFRERKLAMIIMKRISSLCITETVDA